MFGGQFWKTNMRPDAGFGEQSVITGLRAAMEEHCGSGVISNSKNQVFLPSMAANITLTNICG